MLVISLVLARLVVEPNTPAPQLTEDAVLLVERHFVDLGCDPTPIDDAGIPDAGSTDAGPSDGGATDAGVPDPGCQPILGDAISMVIQPHFTSDANGARFALLFVTPSRPIVETVGDPFPALVALTATKIEERIVEVPDPRLGETCRLGNSGGCGFGATEPRPSFDPPGLGDGGLGDGPVEVEMVGPYQVVRVQPEDTAALAALLDSFGYVYQQADLDALAPYLDRGFTVVAVRVAIDQPTHGSMRPLSMTWAGTELRLPAALGSGGAITAYIAGDGRYEFDAATVPFAKQTFSNQRTFVTRNDLPALDVETPDDDPIAHRIDGDPEVHETIIVDREKRVPVSNCGESVGCCRDCNASGPRADFGVLGAVVLVALRRRRRTRSSR